MDQEIMMKAQQFDNRIKELHENLEFIDSQVSELDLFKSSIADFSKFEGNEIISSIGKGVHIPAEIKSKELLLEVGAGIVLKKTPEQALSIIDSQISRIKEARINILSEIDFCQTEFQSIIKKLKFER